MASEQEEAEARKAIQSATTETEYKNQVWTYRKTNYVTNELKIKVSNKYHNATYRYDRANRIVGRASGSEQNRAIAKDRFVFMGGSLAQWRAKIQQEKRDRTNSQRQSASMRETGNAQIAAGQAVELNRLGNGISSNINQNRTSKIAQGTAAQAQPWEKGFTEDTKAYGFQSTGSFEQERLKEIKQYENQQKLKALGLTHDIKQLDALGLSTIYQQPIQTGATMPTIQKQQATPPSYLYTVNLNEGKLPPPSNNLSYIGYGKDGAPIQGAVKGETTPMITPFGNLGFQYQGSENVFNRTPVNRDFGKMDYAYLVDQGLAKREGLMDHLAYYAAIGERPITNTLAYLGVGEGMKQYVTPTTSQQVFTNLDEAYNNKKPLSQGIGETWNKVKADPLKTLVEIPGEAGMWIGAGKVLGLGTSLAVKGGKAISQSPGFISKTLKPESLGSTVMVKKSAREMIGGLGRRQTTIEKTRQADLAASQKYWKSITPTQQNIKSIGLSRNRAKLRYTVLEKYKNPDYYKRFNRTTKPSFTSTGTSMGISIGAVIARAKVTEPKVKLKDLNDDYKPSRRSNEIDFKDNAENIIIKTDPKFTKPTKRFKSDSEIIKDVKASGGTISKDGLITKPLTTKTKQIQKVVPKTVQQTKQVQTTKLKTTSITKVRLKPKVKSKLATKSAYGTLLKQSQSQSQKTRQRQATKPIAIQRTKQINKPQLIAVQKFKPATKLKPKVTPKLTPKLKQLTPVIPKITPPTIPFIPAPPPVRPTPPRRPLIIPLIPGIHKRRQVKPRTTKRARVDFIGNTRVAQISGFRTKKSSISYGKKTQRIYDDDLNWSKKKYKKSLKLLKL